MSSAASDVYKRQRMWGHGVLPAALPAPFSATLSPALSVYLRECRATGSASGQTACPVGPTLRQSWSCHGNSSPLCPGCPSPPLLLVWMNVYFLSTWCRTSLPFNFLSVLVVRGGAVCLPTPPSWFSWSLVSLESGGWISYFLYWIFPICPFRFTLHPSPL